MLPFDSWPLGMVSLWWALNSAFCGSLPPAGGPRERILATESENLHWRGSLEVISLLTINPPQNFFDEYSSQLLPITPQNRDRSPSWGWPFQCGLALITSTKLEYASLEFLFSASGTTQSPYNLPRGRSRLTGIPWAYLPQLTLFFGPFCIFHGF